MQLARTAVGIAAMLAAFCFGPACEVVDENLGEAVESSPQKLVNDRYLLKDIDPGPVGSYPYYFASAGGLAFFTAETRASGVELYATDGTPNGTVRWGDICPGTCSSAPAHLTAAGSSVYFEAWDPLHGKELWRASSEMPGVPVQVADLSTTYWGTQLVDIVAAGDAVYFTAVVDDQLRHALFRASPATSYPCTESWCMPQEIDTDGPVTMLTTIDDVVYFTTTDLLHGNELWKVNASGGAVRLTDINNGLGDSNPTDPISVDGSLFFIADDGLHGRQIWRLDPSTPGSVATIVTEPDPQSLTAYPTFDDPDCQPLMVALGHRFFFAAHSAGSTSHGCELWTSDGTTAGTVELADINPGWWC